MTTTNKTLDTMGELTCKDYLDETWISFALFLAVIPMIYNISLAMKSDISKKRPEDVCTQTCRVKEEH